MTNNIPEAAMAGILSSLFEGTDELKKVDTPPAVEERTGGTDVEDENEYCFFLQLADEQMEAMAALVENSKREFIYEGRLGRNNEVRIRKKLHANFDFDKCSIETKYSMGEKSREIKDNLAIETFERLLPTCTGVNARVRFDIPIPDSDLKWEVDVYMLPSEGDPTYSNWIKVELEVEERNIPLDKVIEMIPVPYNTFINGDSKETADRTQIDLLYKVIYNYISIQQPFA